MMTKRQEVRKKSAFTSWIKSKIEGSLPYTVNITSVEKDPYRSDGAVVHFKLNSDNITTSDDDSEFDNIVDELYNIIDSIQAVSDAGFQEALNEKEFTWLVYDDRMDANYEASAKKSKGGRMTMKNRNGMKKFRSILYSRIQSLADRAGTVDGTYEEYEQMGIDTYSDNESTLYNAVENSIDQLDEDLSRLQDYLEDMSMPKSTKKSKYAKLHKALNKIGGFTKEEEEIPIEDDDVVEIEDEEDGKVVEIEDKEEHEQEVADGEESEDDNLNESCKDCKSAKAFRTSKRIKMKKGEDMPADADDFKEDNQKGSGNGASILPEDADDQMEENEKGSGNAGSELPEDADDQEDQKQARARKQLIRSRNKNVRKFSVTPGGQPNQESYAQRYQQAPMTRDAIDRHFSAKTDKSFDEIAMLQERIDNLNKSKRNKTNNGVPQKLRRY